jgi:ABC-type lipoprotein release transport system permease subunit
MMIILTLIAAVMIAISPYTDIRMRSGKFAMLRACGMSARQILFMIWRQNIIYPIVGAALSIIPVAACQKLFDHVLRMFRSELWNHEDHEWTDHIPYFQNLYDYHLVRTIAVIFALYIVMILLVTLPQIRFIRKQSIAEEIEKSSF